MKSLTFFTLIAVFAIAAIVLFSVVKPREIGQRLSDLMFGHMAKSGLIQPLVTLLRPYGGYQAGQSVGLTKSTEDSLIASGQAVNATSVTPGALSTNQRAGVCAVAAGTSSVVITNPLITAQSRMFAVISQAAADTTATHVTRVVTINGQATIHVNANATAATQIDWGIMYDGGLSAPT